MAKETSIGIKLIADLKNYQTNMQTAQKTAKQFGGTMKSTMSEAATAIQAFAAGDLTALPRFFTASSAGAGIFSKSLVGLKAALISTGIGAIIVLLGTAIGALTQYFRGTEEGQIAFAKVMNKIKAYTTPIIDILGKLGKAIYLLFQGKFAEAWDTAAGSIAAAGENIKANTENLKELNDLEASVITKRRKAQLEEAKLTDQISELRNNANDEENYNAQQRLAFIEKALKLENDLTVSRLGLAKDEQRLNQLKDEQGDNTIADNDKAAELERKIYEIQKQQQDESRRMLQKKQSLTKEAAVELQLATQIKNIEAERAASKGMSTISTKSVTQLSTTGNGQQGLASMGAMLDATTEKAKRLNDELAADKIQERSDNIMSLAGSFGALGNAIGGAAGSFLGMVSTILGLIPTLISQISALTVAQVSSSNSITMAKGSEAIASGTAASQSVPFPFNIIALAATIASIVSALATNIKGKHAFGGVIPGTSFSGDQILTRVNSGEEVLTANDPRHTKNGGRASTGSANAGVTIVSEAKIKGEDLYILLKKTEQRIARRT